MDIRQAVDCDWGVLVRQAKNEIFSSKLSGLSGVSDHFLQKRNKKWVNGPAHRSEFFVACDFGQTASTAQTGKNEIFSSKLSVITRSQLQAQPRISRPGVNLSAFRAGLPA